MNLVETPLPARGRPRDPQLEDRVFDAAIAVYAEAGWSGFSFEAVARRAKVGKAALYGRWSARGELLRQTLEARWLAVSTIDTGVLREDLVLLARSVLATLAGPHGAVAAWLRADAARWPEVAASAALYQEATVAQGRGIVRRAIARGEVPAGVDPGLLMDLVVGGVTNHVTTTPARLKPAMMRKTAAFVETLVDAALAGALGAAAAR
jgi:AcrR family transcriptional regulator